MPPQIKRVKGRRISRMFLIGSEAWPLTAETRPAGIPQDHTTGWRVYVRGIDGGPDISTWLKKVQFKLFHTYSNPLRTIENAPFEVVETGWGSFQVELRMHFQQMTNEKPQWRTHFLQLEPYGTEAERAAQKEAGKVVSESVEIVEFNEPTEALWDALTSDEQWDADPVRGPDGRPTCELPEKATDEGGYSKQMEDWLLQVIEKGEAEVSRKLAEAKRSLEEKEAEVAAMIESGDLPAQPRKK